MRTRLMPHFTLLAAALVAAAACGPQKARGENAVKVTDIDVGRSLTADIKIDNKTTTFRPSDMIYTVVEAKGTGPATLGTRWTFQDNQVVSESTKTISLQGDQPVRTEFHISKPDGLPTGKYHLVVMLNGTTAGEKDFEVK
ncbi:MAG TPA: hypothetical protein VG454_04545 [Gemmatimonadales bacterium]|nr:hypothetical protein [Gemmatimonadales bacterium]